MKIGILGSGAVGQVMAKGFLAEGHDVWLATREPDGEKGEQLRNENGAAKVVDFAIAAKEAELAVFCVKWAGAHDTALAAGPDNLAGKIVIDTSNLIKMVDDVAVYDATETSGAEQLQVWLPDSKVVKAFNTVGAATMYMPDFDGQKPTMFIAGEDTDAKQQVRDIVAMFGWDPLDAGGIIATRSLEPMALTWINFARDSGSPHHAFKML